MRPAEVATATKQSLLRLVGSAGMAGVERATVDLGPPFEALPDLSVDEAESYELAATQWRAHIRALKPQSGEVEIHESLRCYVRDHVAGRYAFAVVEDADLAVNMAIAGNTVVERERVDRFARALADLVAPGEGLAPIVGFYRSEVEPPTGVPQLRLSD